MSTKLEQIRNKAKAQSKQNIVQSGLIDEESGRLTEISLEGVLPNPYQPRKIFDGEKMKELIGSIKQHGLLQPILVADRDGKYVIIAGERRYRAVKELGQNKISAKVLLDVTDEQLRNYALVENLQREDLSLLDEANSYSDLNENGMTQREISEISGKSKTHVNRLINLLKKTPHLLEEAAKHDIKNTRIIEEISKLPSEIQQEFIEQLITGKLKLKSVIEKNKNLGASGRTERTSIDDFFDVLPQIEGVKFSHSKNGKVRFAIDINKFDDVQSLVKILSLMKKEIADG